MRSIDARPPKAQLTGLERTCHLSETLSCNRTTLLHLSLGEDCGKQADDSLRRWDYTV